MIDVLKLAKDYVSLERTLISGEETLALAQEVIRLRMLKGMDVLECSALGTFLRGGDIPSTIDKARGVLVRRALESRSNALEEAAKICEILGTFTEDAALIACRMCAEKIRAAKN